MCHVDVVVLLNKVFSSRKLSSDADLAIGSSRVTWQQICKLVEMT